ncbi:MAG: T9SS type A sorting domain-containing protein [Chitinophagales bacterium]
MFKHITTILLLTGMLQVSAQVNIVITGTPITESFTGFTGAGFTPTPGAGQLDADNWQITGFNEGDLLFGGTKTTGDFARGSTGGNISTGGIYSLLTAAGANQSLYFQPTADDITPGSIALVYKNITGTLLTELDFSYVIYLYNNESRSTTLKLSYSTDNITYTDVPSMDFTSLGALDASLYTYNRSVALSGLSIPNNTFIYFKWTTDDAPGGAGNRDEIGLDNITLTAGSDPIPTPTVYFNNDIIYAYENNGSFSFDVNIATPHDCNAFITLNPEVTLAKEGVDYTFSSPTMISFTTGGPTTQTVVVPLTNDNIPEYMETMYFELDSVSPGCLIVAPTFQLVFIQDSDVAVIGDCENLIISQYGEGTGILNNKALEIYNPTDAAVNLEDYYVHIYSNGGLAPVYYFQGNGMLAPGDAYVITTEDANPPLLAQADTTGQGAYFNGNDAVVLNNGPYMIDKIGEIGIDPGITGWLIPGGSTTDNSLVRKSSVTQGQLDWSLGVNEWNVIGPNNFAGLNTHVYDGCGCPAPTGFAVMNITSSTFKAVWDAMPGATKYQVWYRQSGIGAPWSKKNTTTNSKKIIGLLPSTLYEVKVKTFCGVLGSEFTTTLFVTTGPLRAGEIESSFNLFPNPNNGLFTIELPTDLTENADLFIYDITGALVLKQTVEAQTNSLTIDLTKLPKGSYIVRLISVNSASTEILVIE